MLPLGNVLKLSKRISHTYLSNEEETPFTYRLGCHASIAWAHRVLRVAVNSWNMDQNQSPKCSGEEKNKCDKPLQVTIS